MVNVCVKKNLHKWEKEGKYQPNVHHLYVGGLGEAVGHADEHGGEDQHAGEAHITVTTASKKKALKKFVTWPIRFKRTVGK